MNNQEAEMGEFKRRLERTTQEDFDGHTDFKKLTPEQKLEWLAQIAQFVTEVRGDKARPARQRPRSPGAAGITEA